MKYRVDSSSRFFSQKQDAGKAIYKERLLFILLKTKP